MRLPTAPHLYDFLSNPLTQKQKFMKKRIPTTNRSACRVLLLSLLLTWATCLSMRAQTIQNVNPTTTVAGQNITMIITGNNTNFNSVTGLWLRHSVQTGTVYQGLNFNATSPTNSTVNFTIPPNAPLGNYNLQTYGQFATFTNALNVGVGPGSNYGQVSGKVILDNNSNCTEDVGDVPVAGQIITISPGPYYATTGTQGDFSAWVPLGNYTLATNLGGCGSYVCGSNSQSANLPVSLSTDVGNDFYFHTTTCADLSTVFSANPFRPGFTTNATLNVRNLGSSAVSNGTVTLIYNGPLTLSTANPAPTTIVGNTLTWNIANLPSGYNSNITMQFQTAIGTALGTPISFSCNLPAIGLDPNLSNNGHSAAYTVIGSFDPNDKQVWDQNGAIAEGPIAPSTTTLRYLIRFQNTGTDTAFNIFVRDTLDTRLNAGTLRVRGASHAYQISLTGARNVQFTFPNIMLQDSFHNEPASHGWIAYEIDLNPGVPLGTTITNRAGIYFDFNVPVMTNITHSTLCALLNPGFTHTNTGLAFNFTDGSGGATTWAWDFGDGTTSTLQNPAHTYATPGQFIVCLTASNGCRSVSACDTVQTCQPPAPAFTSSINAGTVAFTNQSHPSVTSWAWTFGDGGTSTVANPTHTYASNGTYTVCLTVTNSCFSQQICDTVTICIAPAAAFVSSGNGAVATFTNQSSPTVTTWAWTFGDGGTSTLANPTHTYATNGTYNVCLTVASACSTETVCHPITICRQLNESFSSSLTGQTASFQDLSDASATTWSWNFGDGGTSSLQNPTHTYTLTGTFTVCLTVSSGCSTATVCQPVVVCPALNENFSFNIQGFGASFTDLSDPSATSWTWTFGDGGTSTLQNPAHTYAAGGSYNVCLTVANGCYSATTCSQVDLCQPTNEAISYVPAGLNVAFTGTADPSVNVWAWDFGDGGTAAIQNPSHTYATVGSYQVCLAVQNACSSSMTCTNLVLVGLEDALGIQVQVFPNPSTGVFEVAAVLPTTGDLQMRVFDAKGSMVELRKLAAAAGTFNAVIDLSMRPAGLYLLELDLDGHRYAARLLKQ